MIEKRLDLVGSSFIRGGTNQPRKHKDIELLTVTRGGQVTNIPVNLVSFNCWKGSQHITIMHKWEIDAVSRGYEFIGDYRSNNRISKQNMLNNINGLNAQFLYDDGSIVNILFTPRAVHKLREFLVN